MTQSRICDSAVHGGVVVLGWPAVLVGDKSNSGSGAKQGAALKAAAETGKPFREICRY